jgi:hypothetical protein
MKKKIAALVAAGLLGFGMAAVAAAPAPTVHATGWPCPGC